MRTPRYFIDDRGYNSTVQYAGVALKMIWRDVLTFDNARFGFVDV